LFFVVFEFKLLIECVIDFLVHESLHPFLYADLPEDEAQHEQQSEGDEDDDCDPLGVVGFGRQARMDDGPRLEVDIPVGGVVLADDGIAVLFGLGLGLANLIEEVVLVDVAAHQLVIDEDCRLVGCVFALEMLALFAKQLVFG